MQIPRAILERDTGSSSSTDSTTSKPKNLGLILGVTVSVIVILLLVLLAAWRILVVKKRQEAALRSTTHTDNSIPHPAEKSNSNTLRGFKFPNKAEPAPHPRIDPFVLPPPERPAPNAASASADSFGNTASSEYHYKTWRTAASSRSIDDPHMFADRNSQTSPRMQARDGLHSTGEMKDLITMLNTQRVEPSGTPPVYPTLAPSLAVKPMRPVSVASTLVAPHTVTKDFGLMAPGLKRNHSMERSSDGYNSDAASVPSVMRRPKFNPREGAPVIPSIYFQPFDLDDQQSFLGRSNSMDSRRSTATTRVPSQLGRTPSARQNYPPPTTRKRQNSEPPKLPQMPRLATITDDSHGVQTHTDTLPPLPRGRALTLATRESVAPSVSEYPESRAGSIYIDPDMPLSRAPISPTVVPSRNNSARSGWI